MLPQTNWIRFYYFCDFSVCFLAAGICLPGTGSINKLFTLRGGFIPATVSHLPSLLLPLSLSFSLARANNCHGNHQRCQTTNKRKPLNAHLSQKEQNCSLIMMGTIKTVHIYWRGTSHGSICSWIAGESRRRGTGRGVALEMEPQIVLSQLHFNQIKPLKAGYDLPFCTRKPTRPNSISSNNQTFTTPPPSLGVVSPPSFSSCWEGTFWFSLPRTRNFNLGFARYSDHTRLSSSNTGPTLKFITTFGEK